MFGLKNLLMEGYTLEWKNLECHPEVGVLSQRKLDLLLKAIDKTLASEVSDDLAGTFIMDYQKKGELAQCLLRFNLLAGPYMMRTCCDIGEGECYGKGRSSDTLAENSIDGILEWPKGQSYRGLSAYQTTEEIPTGVYDEGDLLALVLNTSHGRFCMSTKLASSYLLNLNMAEGLARLVMLTAAATLVRLIPEDGELRRGWKDLEENAQKILGHFMPYPDDMLALSILKVRYQFISDGMSSDFVVTAE